MGLYRKLKTMILEQKLAAVPDEISFRSNEAKASYYRILEINSDDRLYGDYMARLIDNTGRLLEGYYMSNGGRLTRGMVSSCMNYADVDSFGAGEMFALYQIAVHWAYGDTLINLYPEIGIGIRSAGGVQACFASD